MGAKWDRTRCTTLFMADLLDSARRPVRRRLRPYLPIAVRPAVISPVVTPLELIWNGWRMRYIETGGAPAPNGSVFTEILESGLPDEETYILHRGTHTFALLNAFPYTTGHLMVLPYREIAGLEDLDREEAGELWAVVTDAVVALKAAYRPGGVNVGLNLGKAAGGSISEHVHVHVVPRWTGDGNFMTAIANARTLPEPLADSARRIRAAWPFRAPSGAPPQ
jgi:ATP adenylyltransferase